MQSTDQNTFTQRNMSQANRKRIQYFTEQKTGMLAS